MVLPIVAFVPVRTDYLQHFGSFRLSRQIAGFHYPQKSDCNKVAFFGLCAVGRFGSRRNRPAFR